VKGTAPFAIDRGGYHLHWDAVPAWVCTQCGEPLFEGRELLELPFTSTENPGLPR
jgi:YgiT-type zinc finger domain-containing protein